MRVRNINVVTIAREVPSKEKHVGRSPPSSGFLASIFVLTMALGEAGGQSSPRAFCTPLDKSLSQYEVGDKGLMSRFSLAMKYRLTRGVVGGLMHWLPVAALTPPVLT